MEHTYAEYAAHQAVELLAIDSPTGFTRQAAEWVLNAFRSLGYEARTTVKGGVLIDLGGSDENDGLRVFRHALRHNAFWVQVEDGLFWLLAVFLVFCVMLHANAGEIRFFTILGLFGGMGLYFLTLSRMVLAVSDKIISAVKYMLGLFGRIVTTPFRLLWLVFRRPARKIGGFCEKQRKKLLQSVKLCVKIIIHRLHINRRMLRKK